MERNYDKSNLETLSADPISHQSEFEPCGSYALKVRQSSLKVSVAQDDAVPERSP
ncbi:hypothetical protein [Stenomitos frigidus]|uniref:hypothetical protein n=1 Tax=Stenomitos frigidus TaxID=1886765 RepID=UPI0015E631BB|nr:hypothetical protein [Stenomitos frigidus]